MGGIQKPFFFQIIEFEAQCSAGYDGDFSKRYNFHFNTSLPGETGTKKMTIDE
jgi:hypothetical protein